MIACGVWRAEHPERIRHAGFHINELYSPWSTWRYVVENFLEAKKRPETLKVWINTTLGETWQDEESYSISDEKLALRIEDYQNVPQGVLLLTCGVDVQDERIECLIKGWGFNYESWFIDYKTFPGSPAKREVWDSLDSYMLKEWAHESGVNLRIVSACIDSAGHFTQNVYEFVKPRQTRRIYAIKGFAGGVGRPLVGRASLNNPLRVMLFPLGVDTAKELIYARLGIEEIGPGYMHFNHKCDEEYFKQLTAEKQVTKYSKGFPSKVWTKVRSRNEALDCEVYALCAFTLLNADMEQVALNFKEQIRRHEEGPQEKKPSPIPPRRDPWLYPRRKNFVRDW
jgi:phage terminase large subunit GpA-like protein